MALREMTAPPISEKSLAANGYRRETIETVVMGPFRPNIDFDLARCALGRERITRRKSALAQPTRSCTGDDTISGFTAFRGETHSARP